jgi:hypothetical protein
MPVPRLTTALAGPLLDLERRLIAAAIELEQTEEAALENVAVSSAA